MLGLQPTRRMANVVRQAVQEPTKFYGRRHKYLWRPNGAAQSLFASRDGTRRPRLQMRAANVPDRDQGSWALGG